MRTPNSAVEIRWLLIAILGGVPSPATAQDAVAKKPDSAAAHREEMGRITGSVALFREDGGERRPVERKPEPLHRWDDPTRDFTDGAMWAWGDKGRPLALTTLELYRYSGGNVFWSVELISLAPGPLVAEEPGSNLRWTPTAPGLVMKPVPDAPKPAPTEAARSRQVREIAGRFSASEVNKRQVERRYDLRLLPRPFYRYADPAAGLTDGAFFLFANGTNPEILLVVEASGEGPKSSWSYGLARISRAAPTVLLDGTEVWSQPYMVQAATTDPYFFTLINRPADR
jgi:hypothetical protein